jgi:hypothetical protein
MTKTTFPKLEKIVLWLLFSSTILFLTLLIFEFNNYRVKGINSFSTVSFIFLILAILFFAIFKNTTKKILTTVILTPVLLTSIFMLLFTRTLKEFKLDDNHKIQVTNGGLLACGEHLKIIKPAFIFFDKVVYSNGNTCLKGITKIETLLNDKEKLEIEIFHDGQFGAENPYKETIKKNGW